MTRAEYVSTYGVPKVKNSYGEIRRTGLNSIVFENGWVASIVDNTQYPEKNAKYSVAMCDYNGYFDWDILKKHGADSNGCFYCNTEEEIQAACNIIRNL